MRLYSLRALAVTALVAFSVSGLMAAAPACAQQALATANFWTPVGIGPGYVVLTGDVSPNASVGLLQQSTTPALAATPSATAGAGQAVSFSGSGIVWALAKTLNAGVTGVNVQFFSTQAASGGSVSVSNFPATQPVSATSLPLPAGAAMAANQAVSPVGAMKFATGQQNTVGTSATLIVAARTGAFGTGRTSVTLYNSGSITVFYGPTGVTATTGTPLLPGGSRTIYTTAAIYGVVAAGTGAIAFDEVY